MKRAQPLEEWQTFVGICRDRVVEQGFAQAHAHADLTSAVIAAVGEMLEERGVAGRVRDAILRSAVAELVGLGPLAPLMERDDITEIMVRGTAPVWIEVGGRLECTAVHFASEAELRTVVERMLLASGRRIDDASPIVDARMADGSRVNVVLPPVGPETQVTIRRFGRVRLSMRDLVAAGALSTRAAAFLHAAVTGRANILVSGGTGSGKTTLLGALAGLIPDHERIVAVEDVAELTIDHPNVAALQCRASGADGVDAIDLRALVRNSLRMRPDRLAIGEVRGAETVDMIQALNTGHSGSMTTVHANSAADALMRVESLLALGLPALGVDVTQRWIAAALDVVVHVERGRDGIRRVVDIASVDRDSRGIVATSVFAATNEQIATGTGAIPRRCLGRMAAHGVVFPPHLLVEAAAA